MDHQSSLFDTAVVGGQPLRNRIVLPPLTRSRADDDGVPTPLMEEYYRQRAGAGLVISEGTVITPQASAYARVPGLYSAEQVAAWRPVVEAAKREGAVVYAQLWHVGRQSHSSVQPDGLPPKAPSPVAITGYQYRSATRSDSLRDAPGTDDDGDRRDHPGLRNRGAERGPRRIRRRRAARRQWIPDRPVPQ